MTARELAAKCRDIATNYLTCYVWGGCGMPVTQATIRDKLLQYPAQNQKYCAEAESLIGRHAWMFDCVCLIKSVLWGWNGDWNKYFGGAVYRSNGVPDVSADGMIGLCRDVKSSFSSISVGEALWCSGHIGVYIGEGIAVECTPAFEGGVQITGVSNIAKRANYYNRFWTKHGKLPWVVYTDEQPEEPKNSTIIVDGVEHPINRILQDGRNYYQLRDLAAILGDGFPYEISNIGSIAVLTRRKEQS